MRSASLSVRAMRKQIFALLSLCVLATVADAQTPGPASAAPTVGSYVGAAVRDPMESMYGNTLVCAAAQSGQDLCHLWVYRDGTFINFDSNGAHTGHYSVGPVRADGKVPMCQYWDTTNMISPAEFGSGMPGAAPQPQAGAGMAAAGAAPGPAGAAPPAAGGRMPAMVCKNENYRTTCTRGVDPNTLSEEDKKRSQWTMAERFHGGMCYPMGGHEVGDVWFEFDDPLPGQLGLDKMFLLPGHQ